MTARLETLAERIEMLRSLIADKAARGEDPGVEQKQLEEAVRLLGEGNEALQKHRILRG